MCARLACGTYLGQVRGGPVVNAWGEGENLRFFEFYVCTFFEFHARCYVMVSIEFLLSECSLRIVELTKDIRTRL